MKKLLQQLLELLKLITAAISVIVLAIASFYLFIYYLFAYPKWQSEITSGKYESFEIGLEKKEVMAILINLTPKEPKGGLHHIGTSIEESLPIERLTPEAKDKLQQFNEWHVKGIVGVEHCEERPDSTLYFTADRLSKIKIKCFRKK